MIDQSSFLGGRDSGTPLFHIPESGFRLDLEPRPRLFPHGRRL
jgi:hypothetical protein